MHRFQVSPTPLPSPKTLKEYALIAVPLCAIAGALNAVAFLAATLMASHVTGNWTRVGTELATGQYWVGLHFLQLGLSFLAGGMASTFLVEQNLDQDRRLRYIKPLVLELATILLISVAAVKWHPGHWTTACLFAFALGNQNATITKVSGAAVRTTHMTGITTDLGIELTRVLFLLAEYFKRRRAGEATGNTALRDVRNILAAELAKTLFLASMLSSFVVGALLGSFCYLLLGIFGTLPPAGVLAALIVMEVWLYRSDRAGFYAGNRPATTRYPRTMLVSPGPPPAESAAPAPPPEAKLGSP